MRSLDTQMDFDITLATKKSNENPVYYVQYAHARICSILKELKTRVDVQKYETINSEYAYNLLNKIYEFKDVAENAALKQLPHLITNYVYDLATMFHTFYAHEKILTDDIKYTSERINLIECVKITIKNALNLIGVEALEKM
jgi:arginyl-tRNA synthetase